MKLNQMIKKEKNSFLIILLLTLLSFSQSAYSEVDYKGEALIRTYPSGAFAKGTVGKSFEMWRKKASPVTYGFARVSTNFQTSLFVNSLAAQVDVYPISILGLYGGYSYMSREYNELKAFNCDVVICRTSQLIRKYYGFRMALAYKDLFYMGDTKWSDVEAKDLKGQFGDEQTSLIGQSGGDNALQSTHVLGLNIKKNLAIGILAKFNQMDKTNQRSQMRILFGKYEWGKYSLLAGPGLFKTRAGKEIFTALATIKWTGSKGLLLF